MSDLSRSRWTLPLFSVFMGGVLLAAAAYGGNARDGVWMFGVLALFGVGALVAGRYSETIGGLSGPGRDERMATIDLRATALSGLVVISAVIVGFILELAQGRDGSPYGQLGAVGGLSYVAAVVFFRMRG